MTTNWSVSTRVWMKTEMGTPLRELHLYLERRNDRGLTDQLTEKTVR